jgi:RHS repeat-associated protein
VSYAVATDRLGSPRLVRSSAGAVVRTDTWDPTGRPLAGAGAFDLVIGWGGGITDPVTGLVRFGLRDYDPDTGRWTTPDPALFGGGSTNLYVHAGNDPVSLVDRSGAFSIEGSFYQGIGGGGKLAVTSEGFSFCTEVGVGFGVSAGVSLDGGLDPTGHTGFAELQAGVGQFALALRGQQDLVHGGCPSQLSFKACALACGTFEVFPQEGDGMVRPADGLPSFEPQLESNLKPSSPKALSIQAKMGISSCASFSW